MIWLTEEAEDDMAAIFAYTVKTWGEGAAARYTATLERCWMQLQRFPNSGHPRADLREGLRCLIGPKRQHLILYHVAGKDISIVRVLHARQNIRREFRPSR